MVTKDFGAREEEDSVAHESDDSNAHENMVTKDFGAREEEDSVAHESADSNAHESDDSNAHESDDSNAHESNDSRAHERDSESITERAFGPNILEGNVSESEDDSGAEDMLCTPCGVPLTPERDTFTLLEEAIEEFDFEVELFDWENFQEDLSDIEDMDFFQLLE